MSERVHHCPFLNRSDDRCSSHFSLDHLTDAFAQCFDQYAVCPVYREMLLERRTLRGEAGESVMHVNDPDRTDRQDRLPGRLVQPATDKPYVSPIVQLTIAASVSTIRRIGPGPQRAARQPTIADAYAQSCAAGPGLSLAPAF